MISKNPKSQLQWSKKETKKLTPNKSQLVNQAVSQLKLLNLSTQCQQTLTSTNSKASKKAVLSQLCLLKLMILNEMTLRDGSCLKNLMGFVAIGTAPICTHAMAIEYSRLKSGLKICLDSQLMESCGVVAIVSNPLSALLEKQSLNPRSGKKSSL